MHTSSNVNHLVTETWAADPITKCPMGHAGFLKWGYPQFSSICRWIFHYQLYKPSIFGYVWGTHIYCMETWTWCLVFQGPSFEPPFRAWFCSSCAWRFAWKATAGWWWNKDIGWAEDKWMPNRRTWKGTSEWFGASPRWGLRKMIIKWPNQSGVFYIFFQMGGCWV